jgi:hypothetical protein
MWFPPPSCIQGIHLYQCFPSSSSASRCPSSTNQHLFFSSNAQMSMYFSLSQLLFNSLYNARDLFSPHIYFYFLTFNMFQC